MRWASTRFLQTAQELELFNIWKRRSKCFDWLVILNNLVINRNSVLLQDCIINIIIQCISNTWWWSQFFHTFSFFFIPSLFPVFSVHNLLISNKISELYWIPLFVIFFFFHYCSEVIMAETKAKIKLKINKLLVFFNSIGRIS